MSIYVSIYLGAELISYRIVDQSTEEAITLSPDEEIPWPALENLSPSNLKRTVSTLMKEWEKSLSPREGQQNPLSSSTAAERANSPKEGTSQSSSL